jgi:hypothetical protein
MKPDAVRSMRDTVSTLPRLRSSRIPDAPADRLPLPNSNPMNSTLPNSNPMNSTLLKFKPNDASLPGATNPKGSRPIGRGVGPELGTKVYRTPR